MQAHAANAHAEQSTFFVRINGGISNAAMYITDFWWISNNMPLQLVARQLPQ
jgi:hypothetical protein